MASPALIASLFRISFFRGKRYESDFLSGKIDVFQLVFPIVARTGNDPQPLLECPKKKSISSLVFVGILTKCQGVSPGYSHTLARTTNVFIIAKKALPLLRLLFYLAFCLSFYKSNALLSQDLNALDKPDLNL